MNEPAGTIIFFAGNFPPSGWLLCNGDRLAINEYSLLYDVIGTKFGGDGNTYFQLPNFMGRIPIGAGQGTGLSNYTIGDKGGAEEVALTTKQIPAHSHTSSSVGTQKLKNSTTEATDIPISGGGSGFISAVANYGSGLAKRKVNSYGPLTSPVSGQGIKGNVGFELLQNGNGESHNNIQPSLVMNFIIKYTETINK